MRTTLTLDDDVARLLDRESRRTGASFKQVVNRFLRLGLMTSRQHLRKEFVVTPKKVGLIPGVNHDSVEQVLEALEGVAHR